ncbi:putative bromodomain associated domain, transcription factor TFIID, subunit 8 [Rosa chinensis]|uniref:Transcription initiation factor TFIID subunit 8 n=1 Tax=Rosa chinensis TaxID=74649 RepID=A0A2P6S3V8_ROSCH|nr:transcription initiation factor TFIID subunit 8 [Rosa chinensis]PRQ53355.1 putative bromodomain associated domain, transcription factor TFIID, subunit 8 [Rosa chinensis]
MSDGGGESGREHEQSNRALRKSSGGGDEFARAISKIAVAQVCEIVGFQTFQLSALETLSDVAVQYIRNVGKTAHLYANLSGRTDCNVFDIIQGLEDLSMAQGFAGASDINHCLASSGTVKEISQYVTETEHVPFAYSTPQFPVIKDRKLTLSFWQSGEETPGEHIPTWLPAFPEPHTYSQSTTCNERATEPDSAIVEQEKQQRNVERATLNFQRRLVCNGMEGPSVDPGDVEKAKQARENNPFLATPLQFGETEVSQVTLPAKLSIEATEEILVAENHAKDKCSSVLETFAPAIEAIKNKSFELEEDQKILSSRKPTVQFKIGMSKKSLGTMLHSGPHKKGFEEVYPWFGRENGKDEKKRRAEKILKNSMENSQELAQL